MDTKQAYLSLYPIAKSDIENVRKTCLIVDDLLKDATLDRMSAPISHLSSFLDIFDRDEIVERSEKLLRNLIVRDYVEEPEPDILDYIHLTMDYYEVAKAAIEEDDAKKALFNIGLAIESAEQVLIEPVVVQ